MCHSSILQVVFIVAHLWIAVSLNIPIVCCVGSGSTVDQMNNAKRKREKKQTVDMYSEAYGQ